ncbi:MAG: SMP-30/gluconolactonase/LRE family protein [Pirellula sp.]|jgi:sugar lactone lactonase YvrE/enterochelin esterase-like enzyme
MSRIYNRIVLLLCFLFSLSLPALGAPQQKEEAYETHPDSIKKPNVPEGKVEGPFTWKSKIYPGTVRDYYLYIPSQYDPAKPACTFIVQDGINRAREWKLPVVMDNLIAQGEMPITIGIFVDHGVVPALSDAAQPRFNRSFEYDSLGDRYARFLLEEILPEVSRSYNLSTDPNDRSIGGASSGAICAFNAAWERPNEFRRVLSTIGTYVGLRGADEVATLVRKTEPKPLKIFLQDGSNDLDIYAGSWWIANLQLLSALQYAGYDVEHVWGEGGHNGKHGAAIMPDALRWLWKDHPKPIQASAPSNARVNLVIPDHDWELIAGGYQFTEGPAVGVAGEVYYVDVPTSKIYVARDNGYEVKVSTFVEDSQGASGLMLGPDKKLYAAQGKSQRIVRYDESGKEEVIVDNSPCNDLVVYSGGIYYTDPGNKKIFHVSFDGVKKEADSGLGFANGLILSADQSLLLVADSNAIHTYSYQIQPDGSLSHKQEYGYLHIPHGASKSSADGMTMDDQGRLYVATAMGIQILDQLGRVNQILNKPQNAFLSNVCFGGEDRDWMWVTCGDKVYRRKVAAKGVVSWEKPTKPPKPGL